MTCQQKTTLSLKTLSHYLRSQLQYVVVLLSVFIAFSVTANETPTWQYGDGKITYQDLMKLTVTDNAQGDYFGRSVAIDNGVMVIGASRDDDNGGWSGSAYVLTADSDGLYKQTAKLITDDGMADDRFGASVAIHNGVIVVGAYSGNGNSPGSAYVFTADSDGLYSQTAKLIATDGEVGDSFGASVAIDNGVVVVGAPYDNDNGSRSGSTYVFTADRDGLYSQSNKLNADDGDTWDFFGASVAIDNGVIVVGAHRDDDNGMGSGSVYVFTADSNGKYEQSNKLIAANEVLMEDDFFGYSVAIENGIVVVGAIRVDDNGSDSGSVYLFTIDNDGIYSQANKLNAIDGTQGDQFGSSVAIDNGVIVVGAARDDDKGNFSGSAYVFTADSDGVFSQTNKLTAIDDEAGSNFGTSVAIESGVIVVGGYNNANSFIGSQAVSASDFSLDENTSIPVGLYAALDAGGDDLSFTLSGDDADDFSIDALGQLSFITPPNFESPTDANLDNSYIVILTASDGELTADLTLTINVTLPPKYIKYDELMKLKAADGATDDIFGISVAIDSGVVVIGASGDDDKGNISGSVYVFTMGRDGLYNQTTKLTANDGAESDRFGLSVAIDNGVVVVGAPFDEDYGRGSGSVYIFTIGSDGLYSQTAKLTADDSAADDRFGQSVAIDNGVVVVGAGGDDDKGNRSGSVYIFTADSDGLYSQTNKLTADDGAAEDGFGIELAIDNDVVVVGVPKDDNNGRYGSGSAYVFTANSDGLFSQTAKLTAADGETADRFGSSVAVENGVVVVGANYDDDYGRSSGSAYVFTVGSDGLYNQTDKLTADDGAEYELFGTSVAIDNGIIVVGAYNEFYSHFGGAYVFTMDTDGKYTQTNKLTSDGGSDDDYFGRSVAIDNGLVIVGAYGDDNNGTDSGSVYSFIATNSVSVSEFSLLENTLIPPDAYTTLYKDGDNLSFMLLDDDADDFSIDEFGHLSFSAPPDFETPTDANQDNTYLVTIRSSSGELSAALTLTITVVDSSDTDGDGIEDSADDFPYDPTESVDTDGDNIGDNADTDDDGNGMLDVIAPLTIEATGVTTSITLVIPSATDDPSFVFTSSYSGPLTLGSHVITWTVTDSTGISSTAQQEVTVIDSSPPVFNDIDLIIVEATATKTNITEHITIYATDYADGLILATLEGETLLSSGIHNVTVSATDSAGNSVSAEVVIHILPLVTISGNTVVEPGGQANAIVKLSGNAAIYPVSIRYEISGDDNEYTVELRDSIEKQFTIDIPTTVISGEEIEISLLSSTNAVVKSNNVLVVTVFEENFPPIVETIIEQGGLTVSVIDREGGAVTITAAIKDINNNDTYNVTWYDEVAFDDLALDSNILTFEFDPLLLTSGRYEVVVSVQEINTNERFDVTLNISIVIEESFEVLSSNSDSDDDGIDDNAEGYGDSDNDGIADFLDNDANTSYLPIAEKNSPLQTSGELTLSIGDLVKSVNGISTQFASITLDDITQLDGNSVGINLDEIALVSPIVNFNVSGLSNIGDSVPVVIPLADGVTIPVDAMYYKYTVADGWFNFVIDVNNNIASASKDTNGLCPAPLSEQYIIGINAGDNCLQLLIEDGGSNDADGLANGQIKDPGMLVIEADAPPVIEVIEPQSFNEGDVVNIMAVATGSAVLSYEWAQVSGPLISLADTASSTLSFIAPEVESEQMIVLTLNVSDGVLSTLIETTVVIRNVVVPEVTTPISEKSGAGSMGWILIVIGLVVTRKINKLKLAA